MTEGRGEHSLGVYTHDAAGAAELVVVAAKVDGADAILSQRGGAHDARLDGHVEVRRAQDGEPVRAQYVLEGNKLGMARALRREDGVSKGGAGNASGRLLASAEHTLSDLFVSFMPLPMMMP